MAVPCPTACDCWHCTSTDPCAVCSRAKAQWTGCGTPGDSCSRRRRCVRSRVGGQRRALHRVVLLRLELEVRVLGEVGEQTVVVGGCALNLPSRQCRSERAFCLEGEGGGSTVSAPACPSPPRTRSARRWPGWRARSRRRRRRVVPGLEAVPLQEGFLPRSRRRCVVSLCASQPFSASNSNSASLTRQESA